MVLTEQAVPVKVVKELGAKKVFSKFYSTIAPSADRDPATVR